MSQKWFATSLGGLALAGLALLFTPSTAEAQRFRPAIGIGPGGIGIGTTPNYGYGYGGYYPGGYRNWGSNYYPGSSFGDRSVLQFGYGPSYSGYWGDYSSPRYSYGSNWGYNPGWTGRTWGGGFSTPSYAYRTGWNTYPSSSWTNSPSGAYTYTTPSYGSMTPQGQYRSFYPSTSAGLYSGAESYVQQPADNNALLVNVMVPADAEVMFNGQATTQKGTFRQFVTPALTPGTNYSYEVTARWTQDGEAVTRTRTLNFEAGKQNQLTVNFLKDVVE